MATEATRSERRAMELKEGDVKEEGLEPGFDGWALIWRSKVRNAVAAI